MNFKIASVIILLLVVRTNCFSQNNLFKTEKQNLQQLKSQAFPQESISNKFELKNTTAVSKKSPGLALLFSLILPGAGHYYLNRMDVGKYFLAADAASWIGLISLNIYGNNVRNDSRKYSREHAGVNNIDNKNDDYFINVGNFNNIYEYNNEKLSFGEYSKLYDVNQYFWNWDSENNRFIFERQRRNSEKIYNSRIIFGSILIINRVVSGISAFFIANKKDSRKSSLNIEPQLMYNNDYTFDGVKINLSKNF